MTGGYSDVCVCVFHIGILGKRTMTFSGTQRNLTGTARGLSDICTVFVCVCLRGQKDKRAKTFPILFVSTTSKSLSPASCDTLPGEVD